MRVVSIAGDPGGAASIAPVISRLLDTGDEVLPLAYRHASRTFSERGIQADNRADEATLLDARSCLQRSRPDVLLAATSCNGVDLEKLFINAAHEEGIPSLSVLDFWSNYRPRFEDRSGNLSHLPDAIAVMDELARDEMISEGFPRDRIQITGQPAFDDLMRYKRTFTSQRRGELRRRAGVDENDQLVVFVSQPIAALYGRDDSSPMYLGYTEASVITDLIVALDHVSFETGRRMSVVIRPHPREDRAAFSTYCAAKRINVIIEGDSDVRDTILAADVVIGMTSVVLVEACILGCRVVSLQPGLKRQDVLPTNRTGASVAVYDHHGIKKGICRALYGAAPQGVRPNQTNATARVTTLLSLIASSKTRADLGNQTDKEGLPRVRSSRHNTSQRTQNAQMLSLAVRPQI